jgi:hypothetical protein
MKIEWCDVTKKLPLDGVAVLTSDYDVAIYDGENWVNYWTDLIIPEPLYWFRIPPLPWE